MSKELPHIWQLGGQTDKPKPKRVQVRSELSETCVPGPFQRHDSGFHILL